MLPDKGIEIEATVKYGEMSLPLKIAIPAGLILAIVAMVLERFF